MMINKDIIAKNNNYFSIIAEESRDHERTFNGLVILMAFIGSEEAISKVNRKLIKNFKKYQDNDPNELNEKVESVFDQITTNENSHTNELYDITSIVQGKVKGAQLYDLNVEALQVNPCLN
jgi:hypothetical protein